MADVHAQYRFHHPESFREGALHHNLCIAPDIPEAEIFQGNIAGNGIIHSNLPAVVQREVMGNRIKIFRNHMIELRQTDQDADGSVQKPYRPENIFACKLQCIHYMYAPYRQITYFIILIC